MVVDRAGEGEGKGAVALSQNRGSDVREMGCYFERLCVSFEGGSRGKESADGLGERRGDFIKTSPDATATEEAETVPLA